LGKKKRKRARKPVGSGAGEEPGFGTLGEKLGGVRERIALAPTDPAADADSAAETPHEESPPAATRRRLNEAELMAEAFGAIDPNKARAGKYLGEGYDTSEIELIERREVELQAAAPSPGDETSAEDLLFFEAMTEGVVALRDPRADLRSKEWSGASWRNEAQLVSLSAADLEAMKMTPAHRELLRRSRRQGVMRVLSVRRYRKAEALGELEAFVCDCAASGERFARIVHGKGIHSEGEPVLKAAVIDWCAGPGIRWVRAWAPEIDASGRFGSLVVELVRDHA